MIVCSKPECQTTAGCQCGLIRNPAPHAAAPAAPMNITTYTIGGVGEDYWTKAYRLADELRKHLATMPTGPR